MREIKFRAIIKTPDGKIDKYPCGVFNNKIMISTTIPYYGYAYVTLTEEYGKLIGLQQYTGIKDINGNEVYEGDIILYNDTMIGEVYYDEAETSYVIKPLNEESSYEILGLATPLYIIGNIFENQNLLEG